MIHGVADDLLGRVNRMGGLDAQHLSFANRTKAQASDLSAYKIAADERLVAAGVQILFLGAGRCASMTHEGQSSARVSGACFVSGRAAGIAADLALKAGVRPRAIDVRALQARLESDGACLGTRW